MDEYVSSGVGSVFLVSRTRGYPTSSIYASQKQHGLCLWELWHSVIIITQYGQSSDVVEARRGQTSLGTYIYTQSQARCINNFELHLTSPIVLEVKVLLQIPIRAYKPSPNLPVFSPIRYSILEHGSTMHPAKKRSLGTFKFTNKSLSQSFLTTFMLEKMKLVLFQWNKTILPESIQQFTIL